MSGAGRVAPRGPEAAVVAEAGPVGPPSLPSAALRRAAPIAPPRSGPLPGIVGEGGPGGRFPAPRAVRAIQERIAARIPRGPAEARMVDLVGRLLQLRAEVDARIASLRTG